MLSLQSFLPEKVSVHWQTVGTSGIGFVYFSNLVVLNACAASPEQPAGW